MAAKAGVEILTRVMWEEEKDRESPSHALGPRSASRLTMSGRRFVPAILDREYSCRIFFGSCQPIPRKSAVESMNSTARD